MKRSINFRKQKKIKLLEISGVINERTQLLQIFTDIPPFLREKSIIKDIT